MTAAAIPVTAMTLRRHHSTGTVASANTGTMAHECDVISWTMVPSAIAAAACWSRKTTFSTISKTPSAVRAPATTQSTSRIPRKIELMPSLIARPSQTWTRSTAGVGSAATFSTRDCTKYPMP
jgi:hypothetical protein